MAKEEDIAKIMIMITVRVCVIQNAEFPFYRKNDAEDMNILYVNPLHRFSFCLNK